MDAEEDLWESSLCVMWALDLELVFRLGSKPFHLLSLLAGPVIVLLTSGMFFT